MSNHTPSSKERMMKMASANERTLMLEKHNHWNPKVHKPQLHTAQDALGITRHTASKDTGSSCGQGSCNCGGGCNGSCGGCNGD